MLEHIELWNVGPSSHLRLDLAPRVNLLTGDNGVGKTVVLEMVWWILTRTWAGQRVLGRAANKAPAKLAYKSTQGTLGNDHFVSESQRWFRELHPQYEYNDELVVYAQVDGSFSIRDFARSQEPTRQDLHIRPADWFTSQTIHLDSQTLWNGLPEIDGRVRCNGLIRDWTTWQFQHPETFALLTRVLEGLSPSPEETLSPGRPTRLFIDDARDFPTIEMSYGTIPVTHASAGMQRVVALAYLLVWTWTEHLAASRIRRKEPTNQLVLLFDEVEAHLHPQWQRLILPAVLKVVEKLRPDIQIQVLAATHAPLVLASLETVFDEELDRVFTFELHDGQIDVVSVPWAKQGDATNWLVSEVFGLRQARSREAERAIEAAEAFMRGDYAELPTELQSQEAIDIELRRVLAGHDPFWPRWIVRQEVGK